MGYRSSKDRIGAASDWAAFLNANAKIIEAAGLPPEITGSIEVWDDFLRRGHGDRDHHAAGGGVDQLGDAQYAALAQVVDSYFARGYEYFSPAVLRADDLHRLDMRYRDGQGAR